MLVENVELTLSHVDLGTLNEFCLMTLFGNVKSHCLTQGRGMSILGLRDVAGRRLYPSYYMTHLKMPLNRLCRCFNVWDRVSVGVDMRAFGGLVVDEQYVLGGQGEVGEDPDTWPVDALPTLKAGTLFIVDSLDDEHQPSVPAEACIASLPRIMSPPDAMKRFSDLQAAGSLDPDFRGTLRQMAPLEYELEPGRDVALGHNIMFARFVPLMDWAERRFLLSQWPPLPRDVIQNAAVVERETFYFKNCQAGQTVLFTVRASLEGCPGDLHGSAQDVQSVGLLTVVMELYQKGANRLLAVSRGKKLFVIPSDQKGLIREAERVVATYSKVSAC